MISGSLQDLKKAIKGLIESFMISVFQVVLCHKRQPPGPEEGHQGSEEFYDFCFLGCILS